MGSRRRSSWRPLLRGVAAAAVAATVVAPLLRRRLRLHPLVTTAVVVTGPPALAVLRPRTRLRDVGVYWLQMWAFFVCHELPYDKPDALRRRLIVDFPIRADRALGLGRLPTARLQRRFEGLGRGNRLDRALSWVHWLWFFEPHGSVMWILARRPERFPRAARQMAAVYDIGCLAYYAIPTAPPWWASQHGQTPEQLRRIMVEVGEDTWGRAWPKMFDSLNGNPWAAMPSLHFAAALLAGLLLAEADPIEGAAGLGYAAALGFALVYLGEHYLTDVVAGAALVALVRIGEPRIEPLASRVSSALQRLERAANA